MSRPTADQDLQPSTSPANERTRNVPGETVLRAECVRFSFDGEAGTFPILDGIDVDLVAGRVLGILGPNGCGKTTLLRVLSGLVHPTNGVIRHTVRGLTCGMVFQHVQENLLPWRDVLDNVALPALVRCDGLSHARSEAAPVLQATGLADLAHRYPDELSGGQQQLVSLARWMANVPSVLFVDEGWSMLDFVQRQRAHNILRALAHTHVCAVCVVSHNVADLAALVDRALILSARPAVVGSDVEFAAQSLMPQRTERLWEAVRTVFSPSLLA